MTTAEAGFIPPAIHQQMDNLRTAADHDPELTVLQPGRRWRITMRNERVEMTVDYKLAGRGRLHWIKSTLSVDGQRRPNAKTFKDFVRIFLDPDENPQPATPPPPLPECAPGQLPPVVQHTYWAILNSLTDDLEERGITVRPGSDSRYWVIDLATSRAHLRFVWRRRGKAGKKVNNVGILAIVDGHDRTAEVGDDMASALAMLTTPTPGRDEDTPGTIGASAKGSGFDSVGVRRASVMRN